MQTCFHGIHFGYSHKSLRDSCFKSAGISVLAVLNRWINIDYLNLRLRRFERRRYLAGSLVRSKIGKFFDVVTHLKPKAFQFFECPEDMKDATLLLLASPTDTQNYRV